MSAPQVIPLQVNLANGQQEFPIAGGVAGTAEICLAFDTAPSAGTVTIEIRRIGSSGWSAVQYGTSVSLTTGRVVVYADAGFNAVRLTIFGLTGGALPFMTVAENETAWPPSALMTDGGFGKAARIRVDPGQTGFFAGRFFRSYIEATIPIAGPSLQMKFSCPVDFILWSQVLSLTQGALEFRVYTGATESGTWNARPIIGVNRMIQRPQPYYSPLATFYTGGNFTGGTEVDVIKIRTASQNVSSSNIEEQASERGLPPGDYYGRFQTLTGGLNVNDAALMIYSLLWEERV